MNLDQISEAWFLASDLFGKIYGTPLPKKVLFIGSEGHEWGMKLNPVNDTLEGMEPFSVHILWEGWPAGILVPDGGIGAAGDAANEDSFIEWVKGYKIEEKEGGDDEA